MLSATANVATRPIAGCCHLANILEPFHDDSCNYFHVMLLTKKQKQYVAGCRQSEVGIITVIIMIIAPDA